jgi:hypothetical protein
MSELQLALSGREMPGETVMQPSDLAWHRNAGCRRSVRHGTGRHSTGASRPRCSPLPGRPRTPGASRRY